MISDRLEERTEEAVERVQLAAIGTSVRVATWQSHENRVPGFGLFRDFMYR